MRAIIDRLISWMGLVLAIVLLVAGGMLTWAHNFIGDQVQQQLSSQKITMPAGPALTTPEMRQHLGQYAGQPMTTGPQAKAYADYYIAAHVAEASGGKSYAQVSTEQMAAAKADPTSAQTAKLSELKNTMFMGETLRGLLLYAYAFATIGTIAGYAAVGAYVGGVLVLLLAGLGLLHARRAQTAVSTVAPPLGTVRTA
ncbi:MAG TPA: hypothetical protein VFL99_03685 [Segeticoccus sp.]|uniref:hypothetical protein n=1 Tax=Segeticoccus sp. TaxID=2706531 RepID=UPI002D7F62A2|nr:hypothetical protein [Segeticoccus sp.]HET8599402.1 hypothetical protein [Segeticoccus sp.]